MIKGFDCASPLNLATATQFYNDGYRFVGRYLVPSGWKMLTLPEAKIISKVGLDIVSIFETTADRPKGGSLNGSADGAMAYKLAKAIGMPNGKPIIFPVDYNAKDSDMKAIEMYLNAAAVKLKEYSIGVYGSDAVIKAMKKVKAAKYYMETYAWSHGVVESDINIMQKQNDITVHGIGIDIDEGYEDVGGWNLNMISVDDANKVIGLLSEAYKQGITKITLPNGTVVTVDQAEIHRLANVERIASGQATT